MQDASPEEIWERYSQAKSSSQFFQLSFLFFLGLIPAFIMLGGFKFAIFMALPDIAVSDLQLTCLGIGGAFLTCLARFFFTWIAETQIVSAKTLLSLCLVVQFGTLLACHYYPHDTLHRAAILALYTVTCTVYGAIICLVPTLCSQVFGPAQLSAQGLLFEQSSSIQIQQMAIAMYEKYIYRFGIIAAVTAASLMILGLTSAELLAYAGLSTALAYAVITFTPVKRFRPDIVSQISLGGGYVAKMPFN